MDPGNVLLYSPGPVSSVFCNQEPNIPYCPDYADDYSCTAGISFWICRRSDREFLGLISGKCIGNNFSFIQLQNRKHYFMEQRHINECFHSFLLFDIIALTCRVHLICQ